MVTSLFVPWAWADPTSARFSLPLKRAIAVAESVIRPKPDRKLRRAVVSSAGELAGVMTDMERSPVGADERSARQPENPAVAASDAVHPFRGLAGRRGQGEVSHG